MVSDGGIRHSFTFVGGGEISTIGGIVRTITEIANHLAEQGHEVRYLAKLRPNAKPFFDLHEDVILEPTEYPHHPSQIKAFAERLRKLDTDVLIVALSGKHTLNIMKATEGLPFPIVRSEHGDPEELLKTVWKGDVAARNVTFQLADYSHLLFPEFSLKPDLGDAIRNSLRAIPSPIKLDVPQAEPSKTSANGKMKIISVGRIEKFEKNTGLLLSAFLRLADDFPDWECHFIGGGVQKAELEKIGKKHSNSSQIFFHDSVKDEALSEHYSSGHLFVIPSDSEGCPMALGEALAHGLPAVGFADCTGVNKMIIHEKNGLLAGDMTPAGGLTDVNTQVASPPNIELQPPLLRDDLDESVVQQARIEQLVTTMRKLMQQPELRRQYGKNAPETVLEYESTSVLNQWHDFLCDIASRNADINTYRKMRHETYSELQEASQVATDAIKRLAPPATQKSFRDLFPFSVLYGNR